MGRNKQFGYMFQAIDAALDKIGDRTSLDVLRTEALKHYNGWDADRIKQREEEGKWCGSMSQAYCCARRTKWREEHGIEEHDCRTYETQPRRNQFRDERIHVNTLKKIAQWQEDGLDLMTLLESLRSDFHSIDQLIMAIEHVDNHSKDFSFLEKPSPSLVGVE